MSELDLRTLVVDDEQPARDELCYLLTEVEGVEVVGQAADGPDAVRQVEELEPDLVLLDVQMPGFNGFEVARQLLTRHLDTQVVFVTAYDQHAIEAFEVNAVDYLLKPVERQRLEEAIKRVRRRIGADRAAPAPSLANEELERIVQLIAERRRPKERLALKVGERFLLVHVDEIIYASVAEDTVTIAAGGLVGTSNYRTLDELHAQLDPGVFWRVHRSHVVNINKIKEIVPWFSRNYILKMKDPTATEIPVSRSQTKRLREYLRL